MKEYKVLTQADEWFRSKLDAGQLEAVINDHARQGWEVTAMATASIGGIRGNRDELIVLLERTKVSKEVLSGMLTPKPAKKAAKRPPKKPADEGEPPVYQL